MTLGLTIQQRIDLARILPNKGTMTRMTVMKSIKSVLIGFGDQQMINWRIMEYNGQLITASPNTGTSITLSDEQVHAFADLIREKSDQDMIELEFADKYQLILDADNELNQSNEQ